MRGFTLAACVAGASASCAVEEGFDYTGNDLHTGKSTTASACCQECAVTPGYVGHITLYPTLYPGLTMLVAYRTVATPGPFGRVGRSATSRRALPDGKRFPGTFPGSPQTCPRRRRPRSCAHLTSAAPSTACAQTANARVTNPVRCITEQPCPLPCRTPGLTHFPQGLARRARR